MQHFAKSFVALWRVLPVYALSGLVLAAGDLLCSPAGAFDHGGIARRALERHIRPGYAAFAAAARRLEEAFSSLCRAPSEAGLARTRTGVREALAAWGRIEHVNFGPASEAQRRERLIFWPDRKGLGRRQTMQILMGTDEPPDASAFAGKSAAVQGFTALDLVLFAPEPPAALANPGDAAAARRCRYGQAVAGNIAGIAQAMADGWSESSDYAALWLAPGGANPVYLEAKETTRALVRAYLDALETVRDVRLAGPLGLKDLRQKGMTPPFPESGLTLVLIAANIEGISALLADCGFLDPGLTAGADGGGETGAVPAAIAGELRQARLLVDEAAALPGLPFKDPAPRAKLVQAGFPLRNARLAGGAYLSQAADLGIGLNAGDGD